MSSRARNARSVHGLRDRCRLPALILEVLQPSFPMSQTICESQSCGGVIKGCEQRVGVASPDSHVGRSSCPKRAPRGRDKRPDAVSGIVTRVRSADPLKSGPAGAGDLQIARVDRHDAELIGSIRG